MSAIHGAWCFLVEQSVQWRLENLEAYKRAWGSCDEVWEGDSGVGANHLVQQSNSAEIQPARLLKCKNHSFEQLQQERSNGDMINHVLQHNGLTVRKDW